MSTRSTRRCPCRLHSDAAVVWGLRLGVLVSGFGLVLRFMQKPACGGWNHGDMICTGAVVAILVQKAAMMNSR